MKKSHIQEDMLILREEEIEGLKNMLATKSQLVLDGRIILPRVIYFYI